MATVNVVAKSLKDDFGCWVSVSDIKKHGPFSRSVAEYMVRDLVPIGRNTGKKYWYEDVAKASLRYYGR